jgi:hypothetical protein
VINEIKREEIFKFEVDLKTLDILIDDNTFHHETINISLIFQNILNNQYKCNLLMNI